MQDLNAPAADRVLNPQEGSVPSIAVLRGKRTRKRKAIEADLRWLQQIKEITPENELEFFATRSRIELRVEDLRAIDSQLCAHPSLPEEESEREVEESEAAAEVMVSARAMIASLLERFPADSPPSSRADLEIPMAAAPALSPTVGASLSTVTDSAPVHDPLAATAVCKQSSASGGSTAVAAAENTAGVGCGHSRLFLDTTPESFDGSVVRYKLWRAQFVNYVRRRTEATGCDKLVALCKLLKGSPKELISELPLTDENYAVALRLLDDNYDVPELRQRDVLSNIASVPQVRHQNDTLALRELLNVVQRTILALDAVGVSLCSIALPYEQTIRRALPTSLLLSFEDRYQQENTVSVNAEPPDQATAAKNRLEGLLSFLRRYVALRERVSASDAAIAGQRSVPANIGAHSSHGQRRLRGQTSGPPRRHLVSTAAAAARSDPGKIPKNRRNACLFCRSGDHLPSACTAELSLQHRRDVLARRRRCISCFQFDHVPPRSCTGPREPCRVCNSRSHYTVMHEDAPSSSSSQRTSASVPHTAAVVSSVRAVVMTASAFALSGDQRIRVRCFIDSGSMVSFVSPALIKRLSGIQPQARVELHLQGFASEHTVVADRFAIRLTGTHDGSEQIALQAYEYDFGVDPPANCSEKMLQLIRRFGETHPLADSSFIDRQFDKEPELLIGIDQMYKILHVNNEMELGGGLVAKSSRLGWIVHGSYSPRATRGDVIRVKPICCPATLSHPARDIESLWRLEAIGVPDPPEKEEYSADELEALRQFREGVSYDGTSYTVKMPKRSSIIHLADNLEVAWRRLSSKRRGLAGDPMAFRRYDQEIMAFVRAGHAEEVPGVDITAGSARSHTFYMPHRQVITRRAGGDKWRIVFDCSASAPGEMSLNSQLLPGPNLNPDILRLLLNFRLQPVALSVDVAQAYMTINLAPEDRPYFRYLWQGPDDPYPRCYQMNRVTWGASPSGFLLAAVLREHFHRVDPDRAMDFGSFFYFDDMLRSFSSDAEAIQFIDRLVPTMQSANMALSKWKSNSSAVIAHIENSLSSAVSGGLVETGLLKVLGIAWSPAEDAFQFQLAHIVEKAAELRNVTKRNVLRVVAAIFDPVGWLIPYTVRGELLLRKLYSKSLRWDDPVSGSVLREFVAWADEIPELSSLRIPRLYGSPGRTVVSRQLHIFGDASEQAYAAVAYLQLIYADGGSDCVFVMSKSRVAPRDGITLPRLELMAALLATRLRFFVEERLSVRIDRVTHYTDSTVAFYWCTAQEPSRWKTFVCNRVLEIQRLSKPEDWRHVDGKSNISDIASRGVSVCDLVSNSDWWNGPPWLAEPEDRRPARRLPIGGHHSESAGVELRPIVVPVITPSQMVDLERFGSLEKAVRVVANIIRFTQRCRHLPPSSEADLRSRAELVLLRQTQSTHFADEISATLAGERPLQSSSLASYQLFMDNNGLLRARTRLTQSPDFTFDEMNPIIVPGSSPLATLLVLHHHRTNVHLGVTAVLNSIRRRFWILRGRQVIRRLLRNCVACRRLHGSTADQVQAPLPLERSSMVAPFASTAVDFCGPFYTRSREGTCKNYIALFTCTSIRAIHLELVPDMTAVQTHLALRRFIAEYPACRLFVSDNGGSFVRASADIRRWFNSFRDPEVREFLARQRIDWSFNCPRAPWKGGCVERLVGLVKGSLAKTLGRSLISAEELRTILRELSAVINNRPLSYTYAEADEPRAITPSQFIRGGPPSTPLCALSPLDTLGPNGFVQPPDEAGDLRRSLLHRTSYFRALCTRWRRDYLLLLRSANLDARGRARVITDGSVCLLKEENAPRRTWNLVKVLQGHPGRDGAIRTYSIRFANGYESRRAAQLLIPLEVPDVPCEPS